MVKNFAFVEFPFGGNSKNVFNYLDQIQQGFGDRNDPTNGVVVLSRPGNKHHRAEVKVANSKRDFELAPIRDFLSAIENLGATVEYL